MGESDLHARWTVLQTEAAKAESGIEAAGTGVRVEAGEILVGVDSEGRRNLLIPLEPGEAFAEDRSGRSVHLLKVSQGRQTFLAAVCLQADLEQVFAQFASELLAEAVGARSPAKATVACLDRWRKLFSLADSAGVLTEPKLIGLLAELYVLEMIVGLDDQRRLSPWTGPTGSQHDFRCGADAIEVKGTLTREGRVVSISSVEQLVPPPAGHLHLAHFRFEADPSGDSLPALVGRILALGVEPGPLRGLLQDAGYREAESAHYDNRRYSIRERRVYDVLGDSFPRVVPGSFTGGVVPPGTLRLKYSIDLSNEPPHPLVDAAVEDLLSRFASAR